jgi:hypothetical protein
VLPHTGVYSKQVRKEGFPVGGAKTVVTASLPGGAVQGVLGQRELRGAASVVSAPERATASAVCAAVVGCAKSPAALQGLPGCIPWNVYVVLAVWEGSFVGTSGSCRTAGGCLAMLDTEGVSAVCWYVGVLVWVYHTGCMAASRPWAVAAGQCTIRYLNPFILDSHM